MTMYCDIGYFMISTITNNNISKIRDFITYVSKYFSSLINCMINMDKFSKFLSKILINV